MKYTTYIFAAGILCLLFLFTPDALSWPSGWGKKSGGTGLSLAEKQQLFATWPRYTSTDDWSPVMMSWHGDDLFLSRSGTLVFRVKSNPADGLDAHFIDRIWLTYNAKSNYDNTNPVAGWGFMSNYANIRFGWMILQYDQGRTDTVTRFIDNIREVEYGSWIPRCGVEQMYQWPEMEGANAWMSIGSSDRSSNTTTQRAYGTNIFFNMEGTDSTDFVLMAYKGVPNGIDTAWVTMPAVSGGLYIALEGYQCKKENLLGLRTRIQYTHHLSEGIDLITFGISPAGKEGFMRVGSYGYGSAWNISTAPPFNSVSPYNRRNSIAPNSGSYNKCLEEDAMIYRGEGYIRTTLSADITTAATSFTVNEPALGSYSNYVNESNEYCVDSDKYSAIVRNDADPNTYNDWSAYSCTIVDNGATWTVTVTAPSTVYARGPEGVWWQAPYDFSSGDSVFFWANYAARASGGEDGGSVSPGGAWFNQNARTFSEFEGMPTTAANSASGMEGGISYGLDSIRNAVTNLGTTVYRIFGPEDKTTPMLFDSLHQVRFVMGKVRIGDISGSDSVWVTSEEFEGGAVMLINHNWSSDMYADPNPPDNTWYASAGDGSLKHTTLSLATWAATIDNTSNLAVANNTTASGTLFPMYALTDGAIELSRLFYPFATATGASPYVYQFHPDSIDVTDSLCLVVMQAESDFKSQLYAYPAYSDCTKWWVTASTQASITALSTADWNAVGEDSLGGVYASHIPKQRARGVTYVEIRIPVSASALVDGVDTKLAMRFGEWDVRAKQPRDVGSNRLWRFSPTWSESTDPALKPRLLRWGHHEFVSIQTESFYVTDTKLDGNWRMQTNEDVAWSTNYNGTTGSHAMDSTSTTMTLRSTDETTVGTCEGGGAQNRNYRPFAAVPVTGVDNANIISADVFITFSATSIGSANDSVYIWKSNGLTHGGVTQNNYNIAGDVQLGAIAVADITLNTQEVIPIRSTQLASLIVSGYVDIVVRTWPDHSGNAPCSSVNNQITCSVASLEHLTLNPIGVRIVHNTAP